MVYQQEIPQGQKEILKKALSHYLHSVKAIKDENQEKFHLEHDIFVLERLMNYELTVNLTDKEMDNFTSDNGVDFPIYS